MEYGCPVSHYEILYDNGNGGSIVNSFDKIFLEANPHVRQRSVTGLTQTGKQYRFKIRAHSKNGYSDSNVFSEILATVPDTPLNPIQINYQKTNINRISVSFDPMLDVNSGGTQILSYIIEMDDGEGEDFKGVQGIKEDSMITSFETTNVKPGKFYRIRYKVRNIVGFSKYSSIIHVQAAAKPNRPPKLTVKSTSINSIVLNVSRAVENNGSVILGYRVYYYDSLSSAWVEYTNNFNYTDELINIDTLAVNSIIKFRHVGFSRELGHTEYNYFESDPSQITEFAIASIPSIPMLLTINHDESTSKSVFIQWDELNPSPVIPIIGYKIIKSVFPYTEEQTIVDTSVILDKNIYVDTEVLPYKEYQYKLILRNINGDSPDGPWMKYTTCSLPKNINYPKLEEVTATTMVLSWTPPEYDGDCPILNYSLLTNSGVDADPVDDKLVDWVNVRDFIYTLTPADKGKKYKFIIQAKNHKNYVESSEITYYFSEKPDKPRNLVTAEYYGNNPGIMRLKFGDFTGDYNGGTALISYELAVFNDDLNDYVILNTLQPSLQNYYDFINPTIGKIYRFKWRVKNINFTSEWSEVSLLTFAVKPSQPDKPSIFSSTANLIKIKYKESLSDGGSVLTSCSVNCINVTTGGICSSPVYDSINLTFDFNDANLNLYSFSTKCSNAYLTSDDSPFLYAKYAPLPSTPTFSPTIKSISKSKETNKVDVLITWNAILDLEPVIGYRIYIKNSKTNQIELIGETFPFVREYIIEKIDYNDIFEVYYSGLNINGFYKYEDFG